jgi:hypothetical protein
LRFFGTGVGAGEEDEDEDEDEEEEEEEEEDAGIFGTGLQDWEDLQDGGGG